MQWVSGARSLGGRDLLRGVDLRDEAVLDRVGGLSATGADHSTTRLGDWYVNILVWKPHVAMFVSEATLLPVLMPFASSHQPTASILDRDIAALSDSPAEHFS